jgi:glyoxylase-like metal-dependent hydrolase (beta-lactamase superfamily II)
MPALDALPCTDVGIEDGVPLRIGGLRLEPMHTPGHTDHHFAIGAGDRVFTGDALLIDGCGRTDFQSGDAGALYESVRGRLFTLPGRRSSTRPTTTRVGGCRALRRRSSATLDSVAIAIASRS